MNIQDIPTEDLQAEINRRSCAYITGLHGTIELKIDHDGDLRINDDSDQEPIYIPKSQFAALHEFLGLLL